jgi:poly(3-hydroxybutyrate) depolymerase
VNKKKILNDLMILTSETNFTCYSRKIKLTALYLVVLCSHVFNTVKSVDADDIYNTRKLTEAGGNGFEFQCKSIAPCPYLRKTKCEEVWPSTERGNVYLYKSKEVFNGNTYSRFYHVFVPSGIKNKTTPLVFYLHGGYLNGIYAMLNYPFVKYASGQQETWKKNTASCKFWFKSIKSHGYKDANGNVCDPAEVITTAPTGFVSVFPSGLVDRGGDTSLPPSTIASDLSRGRSYHWEDGRSPSPGWGIGRKDDNNPDDPLQYRDDVGFISHIIETLSTEAKAEPTIMPTIERVVVGGTSNGALMAHRIGCHVGDPKYPGLGMVSALMLNVAPAMSNNLYKGLLGRRRCNPQKPLRVIYTVGAGNPTPDCKQYGCKSPTVDGDTHMPFGKIGDLHNVYSPALGAIVSHNESRALWVSSNDRFFQKKMQPVSQEKRIEKVGFFSTKVSFTFKNMEYGNVVSFVTRPGNHLNNAFVGDFDVMETMLKFSLEVGVDTLSDGLLSKTITPATFPAKQCPSPSPPIHWILVITIVAMCLFCCGGSYFCFKRYRRLRLNNVKRETAQFDSLN